MTYCRSRGKARRGITFFVVVGSFGHDESIATAQPTLVAFGVAQVARAPHARSPFQPASGWTEYEQHGDHGDEKKHARCNQFSLKGVQIINVAFIAGRIFWTLLLVPRASCRHLCGCSPALARQREDEGGHQHAGFWETNLGA